LGTAVVGRGASVGIRTGLPNFPDPDLSDWAEAYHGANHARLARVKCVYDPQRLLRFHQAI
jgi:hypothetical protein